MTKKILSVFMMTALVFSAASVRAEYNSPKINGENVVAIKYDEPAHQTSVDLYDLSTGTTTMVDNGTVCLSLRDFKDYSDPSCSKPHSCTENTSYLALDASSNIVAIAKVREIMSCMVKTKWDPVAGKINYSQYTTTRQDPEVVIYDISAGTSETISTPDILATSEAHDLIKTTDGHVCWGNMIATLTCYDVASGTTTVEAAGSGYPPGCSGGDVGDGDSVTHYIATCGLALDETAGVLSSLTYQYDEDADNNMVVYKSDASSSTITAQIDFGTMIEGAPYMLPYHIYSLNLMGVYGSWVNADLNGMTVYNFSDDTSQDVVSTGTFYDGDFDVTATDLWTATIDYVGMSSFLNVENTSLEDGSTTSVLASTSSRLMYDVGIDYPFVVWAQQGGPRGKLIKVYNILTGSSSTIFR